MREFLTTTTAQAVIWVSILLILVVAGVYVAKFFRDRGGKNEVSASQLMTRFRDLHERGDLSPTEFRQIKSVLKPRLEEEARSKDADEEV